MKRQTLEVSGIRRAYVDFISSTLLWSIKNEFWKQWYVKNEQIDNDAVDPVRAAGQPPFFQPAAGEKFFEVQQNTTERPLNKSKK